MRWLCLHGYGQNAKLFQTQRMKRLAQALEKSGHILDFLEAPWDCQAPNPNPKCWWYCSTPEQTLDSVHGKAYPRLGLEQSLDLICQKWESGNYSGLLGFSQGAQVICELIQAGRVRPEKVILICGFWHQKISPVEIPALCIEAESDQLVSKEAFGRMTQLFLNSIQISFRGPHSIPSRRADLNRILKWVS